MKKLKIILAFILVMVITAGISVYATVRYQANEIGYRNGTIKDALDELYLNNQGVSNKLTETNADDSITITDNTHKTLYVALYAYNKTIRTLTSVDGADYSELFYSYNPSSKYGFRLYKLTDCESDVVINTDTTLSSVYTIVFY